MRVPVRSGISFRRDEALQLLVEVVDDAKRSRQTRGDYSFLCDKPWTGPLGAGTRLSFVARARTLSRTGRNRHGFDGVVQLTTTRIGRSANDVFVMLVFSRKRWPSRLTS